MTLVADVVLTVALFVLLGPAIWRWILWTDAEWRSAVRQIRRWRMTRQWPDDLRELRERREVRGRRRA